MKQFVWALGFLFSANLFSANLAIAQNIPTVDPLKEVLGVHGVFIDNSQCIARCGLDRSECTYDNMRRELSPSILNDMKQGFLRCVVEFAQCISECDKGTTNALTRF